MSLLVLKERKPKWAEVVWGLYARNKILLEDMFSKGWLCYNNFSLFTHSQLYYSVWRQRSPPLQQKKKANKMEQGEKWYNLEGRKVNSSWVFKEVCFVITLWISSITIDSWPFVTCWWRHWIKFLTLDNIINLARCLLWISKPSINFIFEWLGCLGR